MIAPITAAVAGAVILAKVVQVRAVLLSPAGGRRPPFIKLVALGEPGDEGDQPKFRKLTAIEGRR